MERYALFLYNASISHPPSTEGLFPPWYPLVTIQHKLEYIKLHIQLVINHIRSTYISDHYDLNIIFFLFFVLFIFFDHVILRRPFEWMNNFVVWNTMYENDCIRVMDNNVCFVGTRQRSIQRYPFPISPFPPPPLYYIVILFLCLSFL